MRLIVAAGAVLLVAGLSGCSPLTEAWNSMDACHAAEAVTVAPAEDLSAVSEALTLLAPLLEDEVRPAALVLAEPGELGEGGASEAAWQPRLEALLVMQTWALKHCDSYFTLGTSAIDAADPASVRLEDAEVVVGRGDGSVTVALLGVAEEAVALALCKQALAAYAGEGTSLAVTVFDPVAQAVAFGDEEGCRGVP